MDCNKHPTCATCVTHASFLVCYRSKVWHVGFWIPNFIFLRPRPAHRQPRHLCLHFLWHHTENFFFFFVSGYFKSLLCENFKQFGHTVAHAAPSGLFLFFFLFFKWGIVWRVLAGWVRCDGIPQHSRILRVCAFVCALVIISPFSFSFDVWIKMIPSLQRPAAAFPYFHIHTIILWFSPPRLCDQ